MVDLEYKIGGMDVDPDRLRFWGSDPYDASHKFVAEASDNAISIYVAQGSRHKHIAERFYVKGQKVGGGSCYLDSKNQLVLNDYSGDYHAIPKEVAQKFAELILPELKKMGVEVSGIEVNPRKTHLHYFWKERGFGSR